MFLLVHKQRNEDYMDDRGTPHPKFENPRIKQVLTYCVSLTHSKYLRRDLTSDGALSATPTNSSYIAVAVLYCDA